MSAPYIEQTSAERVYHYRLTGGGPLTDGQGRRFQPRHLTIAITENRVRAAVTGTHIKANGEIGAAQRYLSWAAMGGEPSNWNPRPMPAWVANVIARRLTGHIAGPPMPTAWASILLPSEADDA